MTDVRNQQFADVGNFTSIKHRPIDVDENYLMIGNYVEDHIRERIENGEYVDFARLLPRDRMEIQEDTKMEIVSRNGRTYFVPAQDLGEGSGGITNFSRWEQTFRVFSNISCRRFPHRSAELIQYNHVIHTAALTYTWENIYLYDRDFRYHLARFPHRSWAVILQQAWTMRLKDRNKSDKSSRSQKKKFSGGKDVCWRFNSGHCSFGSSCKFQHKCAICNKYGHGAHNCRKANFETSPKSGLGGHQNQNHLDQIHNSFHNTNNSNHNHNHSKSSRSNHHEDRKAKYFR